MAPECLKSWDPELELWLDSGSLLWRMLAGWSSVPPVSSSQQTVFWPLWASPMVPLLLQLSSLIVQGPREPLPLSSPSSGAPPSFCGLYSFFLSSGGESLGLCIQDKHTLPLRCPGPIVSILPPTLGPSHFFTWLLPWWNIS